MYGTIRTLVGLNLGIILHLYNLDHKDASQWGVGLIMVLDLLVNQDISLAIMSVVGWLLASTIFGADPRNHRRPSRSERHAKSRRHIPIATPQDYSTSTIPDNPGTVLHARFNEVTSDSISRIESTSELLTTSSKLPLTVENVKKAAYTTLDVDVDDGTATIPDNSVVTDFRTALSGRYDVSPTRSRHGTSDTQDLTRTAGDMFIEAVEDTNQEDSPANAQMNIPESMDEMDETLVLSPEDNETVRGGQSTQRAVTPNEVLQEEAELEPDGSIYQISDTASVLSTVFSFELDRPYEELCRRAEAFRQTGIQARNQMEKLENLRQKEIQRGNSNNAFDLKFTIQGHREEAERADRKAAKLFYQARNYNRPDPGYEIDVHYLKKEEALQRTEKALRETQLRGGHRLRVIVGKGIHSKGRVPVLKPYIMDQMRIQGIRADEDLRNTGVLNITLA